MKREEPSDHVRLAATNALLNSLEFTKANFDKEVRIVNSYSGKRFIVPVLLYGSHNLALTSQLRFFSLDRKTFHYASRLRGYPGNGMQSEGCSSTMPCENNIPVLPGKSPH